MLALADRIAVMCGGRFTGVVDRAATNREQVGLMMTGTPLEQLPPLRPDRDGVPDATPLGELLDDEEIR